jgi:chaperonin GroEL
MEEGILPGAGKALYEIEVFGIMGPDPSKERRAAAHIIARALATPLEQILANVGLRANDIYTCDVSDGYGYNVKTGEKGELIKMGIVDPLKVTRSALQNAVSVATTILSTNAIVTMARSFEISNVKK